VKRFLVKEEDGETQAQNGSNNAPMHLAFMGGLLRNKRLKNRSDELIQPHSGAAGTQKKHTMGRKRRSSNATVFMGRQGPNSKGGKTKGKGRRGRRNEAHQFTGSAGFL